MTTDIKSFIAKQLQLAVKAVENTLSLLDEGCTIPFISRYRKEKTGGLDEVQIGNISQLYDKMKELIKRKETIVKFSCVLTTVGIVPNLKTSTCLISLSVALVLRLHANSDLSLLQPPFFFSANRIQNSLQSVS